jgi:predicted metalloprotease
VPALFILGRSSALLSGPEIRAQCGNSARWDLCGGRLAQSRVNRPYRDRYDDTSMHLKSTDSGKRARQVCDC